MNGGDLFQRRPLMAPASATTSLRRTPSAELSFARRKKKRTLLVHGKDHAALIGVLAIAAILIPTVWLIRTTRGGTGTSSDSDVDNRFLNDWRPLDWKGSSGGLHNNDEKKSSSAQRLKKAKHRGALDLDTNRSIYRHKFGSAELGYNIYDCPATPPSSYPRAWHATDVLSNWNPNEVTTVPPSYREIHHAICIFDYQTQYDIALKYRDAEKPFIIRNDPAVTAASKKWRDPDYLMANLPEKKMYTERSSNNHFMFYNSRNRKKVRNWIQPPNDVVSMTYREWYERALERDGLALGEGDIVDRVNELRKWRMENMVGKADHADDDEVRDDTDKENEKRVKWYYWRLNAFLEDAEEEGPDKLVFDDLPFFDPRKQKESEFYLVDPAGQRGVNCRFGMRGVSAYNHMDMSRNMIAVLDGERRYIIAHPDQCSKMALYPINHPSGRHSSFDWSNQAEWDIHPEFRDAKVSEMVLQAGDVLYLPTAWFHAIVNLSRNIQCNIRSGISYENANVVEECGFRVPKQK